MSVLCYMLLGLFLLVTGAAISLAVLRQREREQHEKQLAGLGQQGGQLVLLQSELEQKAGLLGSMDNERAILRRENISLHEQNQQLQVELEKRPGYKKQIYRIVTVGISQCGKTALTLKWANPVYELKNIQGTRYDQYQRTVSRQYNAQSKQMVDHVFEILDWGGEYMAEALTALFTLGDIHAVLVVVDVGADKSVTEDRIKEQLWQFADNALQFFFAPAIVAKCRSYTLFINKSDLIEGNLREIEQKARELYKPLISSMEYYCEKNSVNFTVIVGSAASGLNVIHLYSHVIGRVLPQEGWDEQLMFLPKGTKVESDARPESAGRQEPRRAGPNNVPVPPTANDRPSRI